MIDLFHDNFVVVLLILFVGILYWAFKPRHQKRNTSEQEDTDAR